MYSKKNSVALKATNKRASSTACRVFARTLRFAQEARIRLVLERPDAKRCQVCIFWGLSFYFELKRLDYLAMNPIAAVQCCIEDSSATKPCKFNDNSGECLHVDSCQGTSTASRDGATGCEAYPADVKVQQFRIFFFKKKKYLLFSKRNQ